MDYPKDWESVRQDVSKEGHHEDGRTICIHSLAVLPEFQGSGIGRTIMMAYMQQMNGAGIADRLAIISHEVSKALSLLGNVLLTMKPLVPYYEKLGFVSKGPSEAQFGGGGWVDMVSFHPSPSAAVTLTPTDIRSQVHRGTSHVRLSSAEHRTAAPYYMDEIMFSRQAQDEGRAALYAFAGEIS